ncbi:glycoside hydrolase family 108 protein [Devosia sp. ZB163]|uniref:glycoside hydrolase family 108 protein n=1 Tax=Devosia sp. ZB163 TaxID=3025938 RepID=UPI00235F536E|nr:glycoside hydrolase family 108 protein [Devosia sp. ZB163]MDC9825687.1 glycoside hydrolase family 108 protein [Devosia sp. ZB163]
MNASFARALASVLRHEGGYVNHSKDPGGPTNMGITLATFRKWVKREGTIADLKAITREQVAKVYRSVYWNAVRGDDLPAGVDYAVFDYAVNSGPSRAAKALQGVLGVAQDGVVGPITLAAVKAADPIKLIHSLCDQRMSFLKGLKTWETFGKGWSNRVEDVRDTAVQLTAPVSKPPTVPAEPPIPTTKPPAAAPDPAPVTSKARFISGWTIFWVVVAAALLIAAFTIKF